MSVVKHFIEDSMKKTQIDEFLQNEFERAGYGGVSITKTPLGTHLVIYTMRPGLVIGRGGETIRALAQILEEKFELPSPQISVAEIEIPELNAYVVASRIASALKRGVHYRRAGFWGLTQAMEAGALGVEVIISGKLRTDRARYEKFRTGYLPKSGEPPRQFMRKAELHVQLKPGILGVKVRLIPPDAQFPDQVKVHIIEAEMGPETAQEIIMEESVAVEEEVTEPEALPEETVETKETVAAPVKPEVVSAKKTPEPEIIIVEETTEVTEKKAAKLKAPVADKKAETEKKVEPNVAELAVVKEKTAAPKKGAAKPELFNVKEKAAPKTPATKQVDEKVAVAEKKVVPEEKTVEPKAATAQETKAHENKVTKPKAALTEEKKEAEQ